MNLEIQNQDILTTKEVPSHTNVCLSGPNSRAPVFLQYLVHVLPSRTRTHSRRLRSFIISILVKKTKINGDTALNTIDTTPVTITATANGKLVPSLY
jgi:hypothetical protein